MVIGCGLILDTGLSGSGEVNLSKPGKGIDMKGTTVSEQSRYAKQSIAVLDSHMAYIETGQGAPIVFLHGNPTSSWLWRNILPFAAPFGRCIAPDLIGMGDSGRLEPSGPRRYRLVEQRAYLDAFFDALDICNGVTLVLHDWGSVLGFDWANRHRQAIRGIAYMEAVVRPVTRADLGDDTVAMFEALRSSEGERLILDENMYVQQALPSTVLRTLSEVEMDAYRAPYLEPGEGRRAMLSWCREVPFDQTPRDVWDIEAAYAAWLPSSSIPKLFVNADPGAFLVGDKRAFCRTWRNQEEVTVAGLHFIQEDSPAEIGEALASWLGRLSGG
jgi:haloalkane dehalogenase